jgi:hypothetical protein
MRPSAALTCPPPGRRGGAHHAFSIAVIAAGGRSPQPFNVLKIALSIAEGQQKPAEPAESRAKHSHSLGIR